VTALHGQQSVSFRDAVRVWLRVAVNSFGGPAGQIAVMHRILVEEKRWVSERRFLHALNYCMLLPGPEAQQLATYIGWLLHGYPGGLVAGALFVAPGFMAILALSYLYAGFQGLPLVEALFFGLKAAVLAIVAQAVVRIGRKVLKNAVMVALAATAFAGIFLFDVPFPAIVLGAGIVGWIGGRSRPDLFCVIQEPRPDTVKPDGAVVDRILDQDIHANTRPSLARGLRVVGVWLPLWLAPVALLALTLGSQDVYVRVGLFFSKAAVVTFGGAYAVLPYVAQQAVEHYQWLRPGEMLDGLGMAETTPGPLIQVVQFVGFMATYRNAGPLHPMVAGTLGAILTTWVTYVPCFLWIFLGAPYVEWLRGKRWLSAALSAVTAAVVGVVLNLAVWFALHVLFAQVQPVRALGLRILVPEWTTIQVPALVLSIGAFLAIFRLRMGMASTLAACTAAGVLYRWFVGF
jgi:chromate transporter